MLRKTLAALTIAGIAGSLGMDFGSEAIAASVYVPPALEAGTSVQPVGWVYVERRHGHRYRHRRAGYGYFYGGYWYARPWWTVTIAPPILGPTIIYRESLYGPRYRARHLGYIYHDGYWYRRRWW